MLLAMKLQWIVGFIATSAFAGATIEQAKWSSKTVEVCFADSAQKDLSRFKEDSKTFPTRPSVKSATAEEKALIEKMIRSEFTPALTGLEFTGFQDCSESRPSQLYIYLGSGGPLGAANIGEGMKIDKYWTYRDQEGHQIVSPVYVKLSAALPSYLYLQNLLSLKDQSGLLTPSEDFQMNALHEFGHTAGLIHEDERPEANRSANCIYQNAQSNYRTSKPVFLTPYDPASIMSYCFTFRLHDMSGLHYQVGLPGRDSTQLPNEGITLLPWPGVFFEDNERILELTNKVDRSEYKIRIGLSAKDRESIRLLYPN